MFQPFVPTWQQQYSSDADSMTTWSPTCSKHAKHCQMMYLLPCQVDNCALALIDLFLCLYPLNIITGTQMVFVIK